MICPDRETALNALIDGELDTVAARALAAHVETCPGCAAGLVGLLALRGEIAALAPPASPGLAARIGAALDGAAPVVAPPPPAPAETASSRPIGRPWAGWGVGWSLGGLAAGLAIAALIVLTGVWPPHGGGERATLAALADADRRIALPTPSGPGVAKPAAWLRAAGLPTPPVPDLAKAGYRLAAIRGDLVAGHRAAVLIYRRPAMPGGAALALFAWSAAAGEAGHPPRLARLGDRRVVYWNNGRTEFWAIGPLGAGVRAFAAAYRAG